jgi:hypothetical protein
LSLTHSPAVQACLDRDCARQRTLAWRDELLKRYPLEFESGYLQGFTGEDATAYPDGFHSWTLERRNAFFAGWNLGYVERDDEGGGDDE